MTKQCCFEKGYYVRSEISNYEDYRKHKFEKLAKEIYQHLGLSKQTKILDYGAATGGLLSEFKKLGLEQIVGTDISFWAINYGRKRYNLDKQQLQHYNRQLLEEKFDWVMILDVLEHINQEELHNIFNLLNAKYMLVRIPVALNEGEDFHLEVSRFDKTHIQCHCKEWWIDLFKKFNYGIKETLNLPTIYDSEGVFAGVFQRCN